MTHALHGERGERKRESTQKLRKPLARILKSIDADSPTASTPQEAGCELAAGKLCLSSGKIGREEKGRRKRPGSDAPRGRAQGALRSDSDEASTTVTADNNSTKLILASTRMESQPLRFPDLGMDLGIIEKAVTQFNSLKGRLRVSVTHSCQLHCQFCHQEGIEGHWKPVHIEVDFLLRVVKSYAHLGGMYVELTGGEPTLHPRIADLIDVTADNAHHLTLCTNGLLLNRVQGKITERKINLIKLSLHAMDEKAGSKALLGQAWDLERLKRNVSNALDAGAKIQVIFTHTQVNREHLEPILQLALAWKVDVQVVDLINSPFRRPGATLGYVPGDQTDQIISCHSELRYIARDRAGSILRVYRTPAGARWEVKDYHYGVLHSDMCIGCNLKDDCGEGIYALRVDANGLVKPCLLRGDLQASLPLRGEDSNGAYLKVLAGALGMMMAGHLEWS